MGYAVFPCGRNKRPAIPKADGGNGFKDGTTDWEVVQSMWARYPGELVGVATGNMSGVSVLDVDKKHPEAWQWWTEHRIGCCQHVFTGPDQVGCISSTDIARGFEIVKA
jgi:hypothetical protein